MDVMQIRRMLLEQGGKIDTSPVILAYDTKYQNIGTTTAFVGLCITAKYFYPQLESKGTLAFHGTDIDGNCTCIVYRNAGTEQMDYWVLKDAQSPRNFINIGSDAMAFTLVTSQIDNSYAYIVETGQILFAGKNSIYYGKKNIND